MSDDLRRYLMEGEQAGARYRLASPRQAPQGTAGSQLARAAGESMEFMEHRDYQPGDDLRRVNWSAYARTDRLVVKTFRQEVAPHLDLVIDGSCSMGLAGTQKLQATLGLAAALATAAENASFSRRAWLTRQGCQPVAGSSNRPSTWDHMNFDSKINPAESFRLLPPAWRPHGIRVMISDFLWMGDPLEILQPMAEKSAATAVVQVLAANEADPMELGNFRLVDCETQANLELFVDASGRDRYLKRLARHQQDWSAAARKVGATFVSLIAEEICGSWDLSPLLREGILAVS